MLSVRELDGIGEMQGVVDLFGTVWGTARPPVSVDLLRALSKAGNYVSGAFDGERLVGACVGFFHAPAERSLHSHVAGVLDGMTGQGIGLALKLHQRDWALERGVEHVVWTFDPLVGRNAWFNLTKLGARAVEYLPNFYGVMADDINGDDDSDRLVARWTLRDPASPVSGAGAVTALGRDAGGRPVPGTLDGALRRVAVPEDVEALRRSDPGQAREWRLAVRETLGGLMERGGTIIGFERDGGYVVRIEGTGA